MSLLFFFENLAQTFRATQYFSTLVLYFSILIFFRNLSLFTSISLLHAIHTIIHYIYIYKKLMYVDIP